MEQVLVFIHGNSSDGESFAHLIPEFERAGFTCHTVELAGHGKARRLPDYSLAELSRELVESLRNVAADSYFLIGHSLGGHLILQTLSQTSPTGVMVIGTPPLSNPPPADAFLPVAEMSYYMQGSVNDEELLRLTNLTTRSPVWSAAFVDKFRQTDPRVRSSIFESLRKHAYPDELLILRTANVPVKLISCRHDPFVNGAYLERVIPTVANSFVTLEVWDADHTPHWHAPKLFVNEVIRFVRSYPRIEAYSPSSFALENQHVL